MFEYEGPKYRLVMDRLKERIANGELRPGDRMPTVRALADAYVVSHATATKAAREMCREGYAYVVGNATFIRDRGQAEVTIREPLLIARRHTFSAPGSLPGWTTVTAAGVVVPPDYVCDVMEVERGTEVLRQEWVRRWRPMADDSVPLRPIELAVCWFPALWAQVKPELLNVGVDDATSPRVFPGMSAVVEAELGRDAFRQLDSLHARRADAREARLLEILEGDPVQARVTTWGDRVGITQYREQVYPVGVVVSFEHRDPSDVDEG